VENQTREYWEILCEQASKEENPEQLMKLVEELNRVLSQKLQQKDRTDAA